MDVVERLLVLKGLKLVNLRLDEVLIRPLRKVTVLNDFSAQLIGHIRPKPVTIFENFFDDALLRLHLKVKKTGHLGGAGLASSLRLHDAH